MPGNDPGFRLKSSKPLDGRKPPAGILHDKCKAEKSDSRKQQKHHRVSQHDPAGARIERKKGVPGPGNKQGAGERQAGDFVDDRRGALRHHHQVTGAAKHDGDARHDLHAPTDEPLAEILGYGQCPAAAQKSPEIQATSGVANAVDRRENDDDGRVA